MPNLDDFLKNVKKKGFQRTVEERPFYDKPFQTRPEEAPKPTRIGVKRPDSKSKKSQPKTIDLSSNVTAGVTDLVDHPSLSQDKPIPPKISFHAPIGDSQLNLSENPGGPQSRQEKLAERDVVPSEPPIKISPSHRLVSADPSPTQRLGEILKVPRQQASVLPRQNNYSSSGDLSCVRAWQYELLKFFLQTKSDQNEVRATYPELSTRFGRDASNVRKALKKMIAAGLIQKEPSRWLDESQGSIYRLNVVQINELLVQHEIRRVPRHSEIEPPRRGGRSSSNRLLETTTTEETPRHLSDPVDISLIDLSSIPGVDRQKLKKYCSRYRSHELLQDFVDRVAYAIKAQIGTKNEVKFPGGFMDSCFERGVDVPATYKSRRTLVEEEALRSEQAELEQLRKIQDERKKVESAKYRLKFDEWLSSTGAKRIQEFEAERKRMFPVNSEFEVPASVQMGQLRQIQADTFILESGLPPAVRESLIG